MTDLAQTEATLEVQRRSATQSEIDAFQVGHGVQIRGRRFIAIPLVLLALVIVGGVVLATSLFLPPEQGELGLYAGLGLAGIVVGFLVRALRRDAGRVRQQIADDLEGGEIAIASANAVAWFHYGGVRTFSKDGYSQEFPMLIADCGRGDRIALSGQSLLDPSLFGRADHDIDFVKNDHSLNGLPAPCGFPTASFEIEFWPRTGVVVAIRPSGDPLLPQRVTIESLNRVGWEMQPVFVFGGDPGLRDVKTSKPIALSESDRAVTSQAPRRTDVLLRHRAESAAGPKQA